jgi:CRISPR-associated protein Cmr4
VNPFQEKDITNSSNALLGLFTETSLHAGAGQALGVIDLPIQREAHTAWPCVFGSAVKGALRARAEGLDGIDLIFGQADFKPANPANTPAPSQSATPACCCCRCAR